MQPQYLARRPQCERINDAKRPQTNEPPAFSYLFSFSSCIKAKGYRTVTILLIRRLCAKTSVRSRRIFDRRRTCPTSPKLSFPFASLPSLQLAQKKKQLPCTSIQSQSRSSQLTPANTSKISSGRAVRSASNLSIKTGLLGLCAYSRGVGA